MSKISSAHKVENMDKQILQQLQEILVFCKQCGYQPAKDDELRKTLDSINHIVYVRNRKGVPTPQSILSLIAKIKKFPTAVEQKRKNKDFRQAATKVARQMVLDQKFNKIQRLTSRNLKILEFFIGDEEKFEKFLKTNMDPIVTKAFLDYVFVFYRLPKRTKIMIELYVGNYTDESVDSLIKTAKEASESQRMQKYLDKQDVQILISKIKHKQPLLPKEIGFLHFMTDSAASNILRKGRAQFFAEFHDFEYLLDLYLAGDGGAFMAELPEKFVQKYKYQQDMKIQDVPTDILNRAGRSLLRFFSFGKSKGE